MIGVAPLNGAFQDTIIVAALIVVVGASGVSAIYAAKMEIGIDCSLKPTELLAYTAKL